ncbi:MAG: alpha/beta hydrolase [Bradymonadia bacterium]
MNPTTLGSTRWGRFRPLALALVALLAGGLMLAALQRRLMFYPDVTDETRAARDAEGVGAVPWRVGSTLHGWRFPNEAAPRLMLAFHGNAGRALDRAYMAATFGSDFEVRVVEYPGYGSRPGEPGEPAFLEAAEAAVDAALAEPRWAGGRLYVLGESIGTGAACHVAAARRAQVEGVVLVTPFDRMAGPASQHFPWLPVSLLLRDRFENDRALSRYDGRVAFVLAGRDSIVAPAFGQALHDGYSGPRRLWVDPVADHNDLPWAAPVPMWREVVRFIVGDAS